MNTKEFVNQSLKFLREKGVPSIEISHQVTFGIEHMLKEIDVDVTIKEKTPEVIIKNRYFEDHYPRTFETLINSHTKKITSVPKNLIDALSDRGIELYMEGRKKG